MTDLTQRLSEATEGTRGHTPGPWIARRMHTGGFDIFDARNRDVVTVYGGGVETESREANARLIAAAPELLDALRELLDKHISVARSFDCPKVAKAEAAIAKATASPDTGEGG